MVGTGSSARTVPRSRVIDETIVLSGDLTLDLSPRALVPHRLVLGRDGEPLARVQVTVARPGRAGGATYFMETDGDGRLELGLREGRVRLGVEGAGGIELDLQEVDAGLERRVELD